MGAAGQNIRVAILGGGAAALSAAFALTEQGGYDITVYQMGWRLGGKCASGRRLDDGSHRDQEHGLHVLGGFYHNAMGMLKKVYGAWNGISKHPIPFGKAFLPQSRVHILEVQPDRQFPVRFPFPVNARPLGEQPQDLDLKTIVAAILRWISGVSTAGPANVLPRGALYAKDHGFQEHLNTALTSLQAVAAFMPEMAALEALAEQVLSRTQAELSINALLDVVQQSQLLPPPPNAEQDPDYGILFEIGLVVAKGFLADNLAGNGFDSINGEEFTHWMTRHGMSGRVKASSYFRCGYDYAFAYVDGDPQKRESAAGTALRGFLRMIMTYNTSVFVHMRGGMGEIIFVPLYEVLKHRGVAFKFFHRVDRLALDETGTRVAGVSGIVQNEPVAGDYDPLVADTHSQRWVWPSEPVDAQLKHHPHLPKRAEFLYESPWAAPADATPFALEADRDFDICILAIPVGALKPICADLAQNDPAWRTMLDNAATTPTLSAQLWQSGTTLNLGWPNGATVLTADAGPLSTWADMSFLLDLEPKSAITHLSYFCGPYQQAIYADPPPADFGERELARGYLSARQWMKDNLAELLPMAAVPPGDEPASGASELFVKVNSFPSDRYVLTRPGTVQSRLAPGASGLENLFLAGDWTKNGYDIGSFETAVVSGLLCAAAVGGVPAVIAGGRVA